MENKSIIDTMNLKIKGQQSLKKCSKDGNNPIRDGGEEEEMRRGSEAEGGFRRKRMGLETQYLSECERGRKKEPDQMVPWLCLNMSSASGRCSTTRQFWAL